MDGSSRVDGEEAAPRADILYALVQAAPTTKIADSINKNGERHEISEQDSDIKEESDDDNDDPDYLNTFPECDVEILVSEVKIEYNNLVKPEISPLTVHTYEVSNQTCNLTSTKSLPRHTERRLVRDPQEAEVSKEPYPCQDCDKKFSSRSNLSTHKKIHTGLEILSCNVCGKSYSSKAVLKRHKVSHTGRKTFLCEQCGKSYIQIADLIHHKRLHVGQNPFLFEKKQPQIEGILIAEDQNAVTSNETSFYCEICNKSYSSKGVLTRHKRSHTGTKPWHCDECDKSYAQRCDLISHKRSHVGKNIFACSQCEKTFTRRSNLATHSRIHSGEKPFACDLCGFVFSRKGDLLRHARVHKGRVSDNVCEDASSV